MTRLMNQVRLFAWPEWIVVIYFLTFGLFPDIHGLLLIISLYGFTKLPIIIRNASRDELQLFSAFIVYVVIALFSFLFITEAEHAYRKLDKYLLFLWAIPLYAVLKNNKNLSVILRSIVPTIAIVICLAAIISSVFLKQPRAMFYTANPLFFGYIAAVFSIFSLILTRTTTNKSLYYFGAISGVVACILSGTRGALLGWFVGFIMILFSSGYLPSLTKKVLLMSLLAFAVALSFVPDYTQRISSSYKTIMNFEKYHNTSTGVRFQMWKASFEIFKQNPLLGVGIGAYQKEIHKMAVDDKSMKYMSRFDHPHNTFISSLVNTGLIGLFSLLLVFYIPFQYFYRHAKKLPQDPFVRMGIVFVSMMAVFGMTEAIFERQAIAAFYVFMIAILYSISCQTE